MHTPSSNAAVLTHRPAVYNPHIPSPATGLPAAPRPSADPRLGHPSAPRAPADDPGLVPAAPEPIDIFELTPLAALRLLTGALESLVQEQENASTEAARRENDGGEGSGGNMNLGRNGGAPPITPPASKPTTPKITDAPDMDDGADGEDKKIKSVAPGENSAEALRERAGNVIHPQPDGITDSPSSQHHADVPHPHKTPIGSPEPHPVDALYPGADPPSIMSNAAATTDAVVAASQSDPPPTIAAGAAPPDTAMHVQRAALARRFVSKAVPPIALRAYLARLHTYCPLSVAVYLAAGAYVRRLALGGPPLSPRLRQLRPHHRIKTIGEDHSAEVGAHRPPDVIGTDNAGDDEDEQFLLPVIPRVVHRLALAALRVATKALEDRGYAHARVAKVGGVGERELARLEVGLCFLVDFELVVDAGVLGEAAVWMRERGIVS